MSDYSNWLSQLPEKQQLIVGKCRYAVGSISDFAGEEIDRPIPDRFRRIARAHALSPAVVDQAGRVTYGELDAASNRVAAALGARQPISKLPSIGVLLPNDSTLLVALLGIWKSANIAALLDPSFPHQRIASLLKQTQTEWVISDSLTISRCGSRDPAITWLDIADLQLGDDRQPHREPMAEDAACVFFTSGSTGDPKAVVWSHRGLMHQTMLFTQAYSLSSADRLVLLSSGGVNAVGSALIALLNGATALPYDVRLQGVVALPRWLVAQRISICLLGTPLFRNLCDLLDEAVSFPDLRLIRLRSDTVRPADVALFKKHFPRHCFMINGLSSSETGLITLCYFDHDSNLTGNEVPVGYPVQDKEIILLGDDGTEVRDGQTGEIVVRSRFLSSGYWQRPDLTAQKFKADLHQDAQLCFTGDLGVRLPDGSLVHKGRRDFRVKIRGYGVDLDEVEKTLREQPLVKDAVVIAKESKSGDVQLVAYVTAKNATYPTSSELRSFLIARLPHYMIPAVFIQLDVFTLTPNGKIDRQALPEVGNERPSLDTPFAAPASGVEQELARIWSEVLAVDPVGTHDNFFDLGGHSLAATRVVSRVVKQFQLDVPLRLLFESPTVAQMAQVIARHRGKQIASEKLERLLTEIEAMTEEQAQSLLAPKVLE